jgi:predicted DNA binding CopG/RHH family protein
MKTKDIVLDNEELELLNAIEEGEFIDKPLTSKEIQNYQNHAKYTKSLQEKKQTTIRFSVGDLAILKAKSKELGIGYQNIIQALVHNYAQGKIKLIA